jgi:hypothetical protein
MTPHEAYKRRQFRGSQFLEASSHSTDANAETLTEQEMPVLVALRDEKRTQDKGYRGNEQRYAQVTGIE